MADQKAVVVEGSDEPVFETMEKLSDDIARLYATKGVLWTVDELSLRGELRLVRTKTGFGLVRGTANVEGQTSTLRISSTYHPEAVDIIAQIEASRIWGTPAEIMQAKTMITALLAGTRDAKKAPPLEKEWDDEVELPKWAHAHFLVLTAAGHPTSGARQLTMRTFGWLEALYERMVPE